MSRFPDQKAINYAMTSSLTTGGISSGKKEAGTLLTGIIHVFSLSIGYQFILLPLVSGASYYLCPFIVCRRNVPQ